MSNCFVAKERYDSMSYLTFGQLQADFRLLFKTMDCFLALFLQCM